jgi:dynein heavy chain
LLQGYLDYIDALPHVAPPGVFGLHDNADITKDLQEAQQLLDGLLLSQSTSSTTTAKSSAAHNSRVSSASCKGEAAGAAPAAGDTGAAAGEECAAEAEAAAAAPASKSREDVIAEIAADILAQLPPIFDLEATERAYPQDYFNSMNTVLVQVGRLPRALFDAGRLVQPLNIALWQSEFKICVWTSSLSTLRLLAGVRTV